MSKLRALLVFTVLTMPTAASAHTGHDPSSGLLAGLAHPIHGIDHLLAMVAVGILAASLGGRALWALPAAFLSAMAAGGALAAAGGTLPFVEVAIAASVVVLGLAIVSRRQMSVAAAIAGIAVLAVFHGHAHGSEAPANGSLLLYGLGLLVATATLHGLGVAAGAYALCAKSDRGDQLVRAGGALLSGAGAALLCGLA